MTAKNADHAFWFLDFLDRSESADHIMGYCQEHSQPYYTPNTVLCLLCNSVCNSRNLSNGSHHIDLSGQAPGQINQSINHICCLCQAVLLSNARLKLVLELGDEYLPPVSAGFW
jgi:hypothetical protein